MTVATNFTPYFKVEVEKQRNSWCYRVLFVAYPGREVVVSDGWVKSGARSRKGCTDRGYAAAEILLPGVKDLQDTVANA